MPSTYSPDLRIELIANGEQSGTWGATTNTNLGTIIEDAIAGLASVSVISANQAFTALNGTADQARCAAISLTTTTGANFAVYAPPVSKLYVVKNASSYTATVYCSTVIGNTTAAGTGVAIPAGKSVLLRADGTNVVEQVDYVVGTFGVGGNTALGGTLSVTGTSTLTGAVSAPAGVTGNLTGNVTGNLTGNVSAGAGTINTTNWTIQESGGVLFFKYGGVNKAKLDSSGNLTVTGNITAYGTV